jgi:hypothetical protein
MTEPTTERLARVLETEGLPAGMVAAARDGYYDDFKSPLAMPETQLYHDLLAQNRPDLADRVKDGEWDATKEESDAWAQSFEGQQTFAELGPDIAGPVFGVDVPEGVDKDMLLAGVELVGRAGGRDFQVGFLDDDVPMRQARWWARARLHDRPELGDAAGADVIVEDLPGPDFAAEALARKLLDGGTCVHCKKSIKLAAPRSERREVCRYVRVGPRWKRGCE